MSSKASSAASTTTASEIDSDKFKPYTLNEIRDKILELSDRVPQIPDDGIDPDNKEQVREWATSMQAVIEEFNLLLCCVSSATYRWGTDRTGAADQHLGLLSSELGNAQDQISSTITPRITNVLAPVVDLVTKQSITTKLENGSEKKEVSGTSIIAYCLQYCVHLIALLFAWKKIGTFSFPTVLCTVFIPFTELTALLSIIHDNLPNLFTFVHFHQSKQNFFAQEENDPSFMRLCAVILSRNAVMLRCVLLTNFNKVGRVMNDYLKATKKDGQNSRNAFAY